MLRIDIDFLFFVFSLFCLFAFELHARGSAGGVQRVGRRSAPLIGRARVGSNA